MDVIWECVWFSDYLFRMARHLENGCNNALVFFRKHKYHKLFDIVVVWKFWKIERKEVMDGLMEGRKEMKVGNEGRTGGRTEGWINGRMERKEGNEGRIVASDSPRRYTSREYHSSFIPIIYRK